MSNPLLIEIYSKEQKGGDLPFFVGHQHDGGWLRTLGRIAFPILKRLVGVATHTAEDVVMRDRKILPSLAKNTMKEVQSFMPSPKHKRKVNLRDTVMSKRRRVL